MQSYDSHQMGILWFWGLWCELQLFAWLSGAFPIAFWAATLK